MIGIQALLALVLVAYFAYQVTHDVETTPCSPGSYPVRCYHIKQNTCEFVWSRAETTCREIIRKLSLPAGRLASPILFKCQLAHLDEVSTYSRVTSPECDKMKEELEGWKRRNPGAY